jgi:hypothetical protein
VPGVVAAATAGAEPDRHPRVRQRRRPARSPTPSARHSRARG